MPPEEAKLDRVQLEYDGVSGEFAGLLSRFVWVALGFAACYVILSGFTLWLQRRTENERWLLLERFTVVFGIGLLSRWSGWARSP